MSEEVLASSRLVGGSPLRANDSVSQTLERFQSLGSNALRLVIQWLPWIILFLLIIVGIILLNLRDTMFISGSIAAALSLFAFQILMRRIPETLGTIWNRNLIAARPGKDTGDAGLTDEAPGSTAVPSNPAPLEGQYRTFVEDVEGLLNHPGQWLMALFFVLLVGTWTFLSQGEVENMTRIIRILLSRSGFIPGPGSFLVMPFTSFVIGLEALSGFIIGLMAWRMIVVGIQVWRLGKRFDLTPQLGHPDRCGGFEPLGYLCLWNALIVSIAAVFLGGWIIFGPGTGYERFIPLFYKLLLVPIAAALASFFLPLLGVHQEMVAKWAVVRRQLDQLSQNINELSGKMLDQANELEPGEGEKMARKLDLMRQIYQQNEHYPVWPFNLGILIRFISAQAVPVLTLVGLAEPIRNIVSAMLSFLNQAQT
jgi:hypothetical protein